MESQQKKVGDDSNKSACIENNLALLSTSSTAIVDPNRRELLYFRGLESGRTFRYTSSQRAVEIGTQKRRRKAKREKVVASVAAIESATPSSKSANAAGFELYPKSFADNSLKLSELC
jgi:hypothetical protein